MNNKLVFPSYKLFHVRYTNTPSIIKASKNANWKWILQENKLRDISVYVILLNGVINKVTQRVDQLNLCSVIMCYTQKSAVPIAEVSLGTGPNHSFSGLKVGTDTSFFLLVFTTFFFALLLPVAAGGFWEKVLLPVAAGTFWEKSKKLRSFIKKWN